MANDITKTNTQSSIVKYLRQAIGDLQKEDIFIVDKSGNVHPLKIDPNNFRIKEIRSILNENLTKEMSVPEFRTLVRDLDFLSLDGQQTTVGNLAKSNDKIPKGYLAETILQVAIAARFCTERLRPSTAHVSFSDFEKTLKHLISTPSNSSARFPSPYENLSPKMRKSKLVIKKFSFKVRNHHDIAPDTVNVLYAMNDGVYKFLEKNVDMIMKSSEIKSIIDDSLSYVNSATIRDHSNYFHINNRVDFVGIVAFGVFGQKEAKEDIKVFYLEGWDGRTYSTSSVHEMNLDISVKTGRVEQVGQKSGLSLKTFQYLYNLFGLDSGNLEKANSIWEKADKEDLKAEKGQARSQNAELKKKVYELVYKDMEQEIRKVSSDRFGQGILQAVSGRESPSNFKVVNVGGGLKAYFINEVSSFFATNRSGQLIASVHTAPAGNKEITVSLRSGESVFPILKIASRWTANRYANYISIPNKAPFANVLMGGSI